LQSDVIYHAAPSGLAPLITSYFSLATTETKWRSIPLKEPGAIAIVAGFSIETLDRSFCAYGALVPQAIEVLRFVS
jgi:hypothetical protein